MVVVVENGGIFFCVDNTEELTSPKHASQVSRCVVKEEQHKISDLFLSPKKQEETSQLDNIIGPRTRDDEVYMCNDVRAWATCNHYSFYARIQEEEQTESFPKGKRKRKKWTGWKPKTDEQKHEFRKNVMEIAMTRLTKISLNRKLLKLPLVKWRITRKRKAKK